ncbi:hypothetical protein Tco_0760679 [Tanacetum coccineum]
MSLIQITLEKGETIHSYYLRFSQMINDVNTIGMSMKPLQVNTKFVNHLQPERSKFVTNVKLAKDMHTTNFDQLYAYLRQHEAHANEVCLMRQNFPDHLALVANTYNSPSCYNNQSQYHQHLSPIAQQFYSPPLQQQSYEAPIVHQHSYHPSVVHQLTYQAPVIPPLSPAVFPQLDSRLVVPSFLPSDDPIASLNKAMAFISTTFVSHPAKAESQGMINRHHHNTRRQNREILNELKSNI